MNREEASVSVGLDGTAFSAGLRRLKAEMAEFGETGHAGFIHAGNGARQFHKLLEQLTDASPVAGTALKALFSPVTGMLAVAAMTLAFFNKKLEEMNAEADRMSLENLKPISDIWQTNHDLAKSVNDDIREQNKYLAEQKAKHIEILEAMKDEMEQAKGQHDIDLKRATTKRQQADIEVRHAQKMADIAKTTNEDIKLQLDTAKWSERRAASKFIEAPEREQQIKAQEMTKTTKDQLDAAIKNLNVLKIASNKLSPEESDKFRLLPSWNEMKEAANKAMFGEKPLEERLQDAEKQVEALTTQYHKNLSNLDKSTEKLKELKEALDTAKASVDRLSGAFEQTKEQVRTTGVALKTSQDARGRAYGLSPFAPTMDQIAEHRGPYGDLARRIIATRGAITQRMAMGDLRGAEYLRKQLQGYDEKGYDMPDWTKGGKLMPTTHHVKGLEDQFSTMQTALEKLAGFASGDGLPVLVKGVAD